MCMPVKTLHIMSLAHELTSAEDDLLAQCSSCQQLVLLLKDRAKRLRAPPEGTKVLYQPFPLSLW